VYQYAISKVWLKSEPTLHVVKYWNYHKTREPKEAPIRLPPDLPDLPDLPDPLKNQEPALPEPPVDSPKPEPKPNGLDPGIKAVADRIYQSDRVKFQKLVVWIKQAEKNGWQTNVVTLALERFEPYAGQVEQWYPYLDKLIYKADKDINRDFHEAEHKRHKEEIRELSKSLALKGLVKNA
jgi:hypothetical protein